jgi:hypothetical protein
MIVKQVSVFLENKLGRLNEVTQVLGEAGINISAFTIADTSDFGILRLIVEDPEKAKEVLKQNRFLVQTNDVVLVKSPNKPGGLANLLKILNQDEIFIEYMYAFSMNDTEAVIVIRPMDVQKCLYTLEKNKHELLYNDKNYQL